VEKDKNRAPDFKAPYLIFLKMRKKLILMMKASSVKLLLNATGKAIDNPTIQVQPIFDEGTTEQFV
jgi:hypothetical protein